MPGSRPPRCAATCLFAIEVLLFVAATLALGWYAGVQILAARDQASWARELETAWSGRALHKSSTHRQRTVAPGGLVGRLELPRIGLSVIVREGVDTGTLRSAVGHIPDTALPGESGNVALAGHRDTFFRQLKHVRPGDRVVVTTVDGIYDYVVRDTRVVTPRDVSVLAPGSEATVTLVTCYPFDYIGSAPQRFVVRATRDTP